jgi:two-component system, NtrC family, nitrogen regulation sensor histidine kinase NtrY
MKRETTTLLRLGVRRFGRWAARHHLGQKLSIVLLAAALAAGVCTYMAFTGVPPFTGDVDGVLLTLYADLAIGLLLGGVVAHRLVALWGQRLRGSAGAKLHARLVMRFVALAVTPTAFLIILSGVFFHKGIEAWFTDKVGTAVRSSVRAAEGYLSEHKNLIRADALAMANDLNTEASRLIANPGRLNQVLSTQALFRNLTEAIVIDGQGRVLGRTGLSFSLQFERFPVEQFEAARRGEPVMLISDKDDRVRSMVPLEAFQPLDAFLVVGRPVDPVVLAYIESTRRAADEYELLRGKRAKFQVTFVGIFAAVAVLLLLVSLSVGLIITDHVVRPIVGLIQAAERMRGGDLTARVPEVGVGDEIGSLSRAFNRMASQLANQQHELLEANRQLDLRNRFTEAVLSGVTAGVIGLDHRGRVNLPNRVASQLLDTDLNQAIGHELAEVVPEMAAVVADARKRPERTLEAQIKLSRAGSARTLLVRVSVDVSEGEVKGFVITFDDITELQSAQRKAAWADVARRIAHEIKNPLTPIQLSAERLKRKYLKEISSDPETFKNCTDTIVRQVGDIGRMVDEFSAFARMPTAVMKGENMAELCQHALYLQKNARGDVDFKLEMPAGHMIWPCDSRQVGQALTNLLQNALDAIDGRDAQDGVELPRGRIDMTVARDVRGMTIAVADNGKGLPQDDRERLTEPYVTTRTKGTGLGLAIVKKIMEDHGGEVRLADNPGGGAIVTLDFPQRDAGSGGPESKTDSNMQDNKTKEGAASAPTLKPQAVAHGA